MNNPTLVTLLALTLSLAAGCGQSPLDDSPGAAPGRRPEVQRPSPGAALPKPVAAKPAERDHCDCDKGNCAADEEDARVEEIESGASPARGAEAAPVTVVVFSDLQCPFCRKAEGTVRALEAAYPGKIRYVWKNHPLPFHDRAHLAAKAALAANDQGKFWEYQAVLFAHQDALDRASLERYADEVGLDRRRFQASLEGIRLDSAVDADEAEAERLAIKGTPTFFVNGRRIIGAQPLAKFKEQVDEALASR